MNHICRIASVVIACAVPTLALAGPDWVEGKNDAGSFFDTAQRTFGVGQLLSITGSLSIPSGLAGEKADYEDVYLISITDPMSFKITLGAANFNLQLFLFNVTMPGELFGLLGNQGTKFGGTEIGPMATDGTGAQVLLPGTYALAIAGLGRMPHSINGPLFNFGSPFEVSGPDGPGGFNPLSEWVGEGEVGDYDIHLEGVGYFDVPAPGAIALLAMAGLTNRRRRR